MKTKSLLKRVSLVQCSLAIAFGFALTASAQVLYSDHFDGAVGAINGRTPDTADVGGALWIAPAQFGVNGSGVGVLTAVPPNGAGNGAGPSLSFTPDGISTYVLSIDLVAFGDANANHWFDLAFVGTSDGSTWFNDGRAAMVITPTLQAQTYYGNTGGNFGAFSNQINFTLSIAPATYSLTLNSATGELIYKQNDTVLRTVTLSATDIAAIGGVTFGAGQGTVVGLQYDNFTLTQVVPEPSTTMLLLGGTGMLFFFWRSRRRA